VYEYGFIRLDDFGYVMENDVVRGGLTWESFRWAFQALEMTNWHPVTWLSHMLDCQIFGPGEPGWHHVTNVVIHAVSALLVFLLLQQMTGAFWRSAFVAAIFALHPTHVESVAWISERKDVLSTFFWLAQISAYVRYAKTARREWLGLSLVLLALGLMAKPMLVTAPFLLLLLDYWPLNRLGGSTESGGVRVLRGLILEKLPFFALAFLSMGATCFAQAEGGALSSLPLQHRVANALVAYLRYLGKTLWPEKLAVIYPNHVGMWGLTQVLGAALVLFAVSAAVVVFRRRRYLTVGWLWYLGTLVPVIGLVQVGDQAMADRYLYMPMTGLLIMLAWGAADLCRERKTLETLTIAAALGSILACVWATPRQVAYWRDSEVLFTHALEVTEDNATVHHLLGQALNRRGRHDEAMEQFRLALQISPASAKSHNSLATAFIRAGRADEAVEHLQEAVRLEPELSEAHYNLGGLLVQQRQLEAAEAQFRRVIELAPDDAGAHLALGQVLEVQGRSADAAFHRKRADEIGAHR
jgi:tetratricopeptide (TPR) repeat protein